MKDIPLERVKEVVKKEVYEGYMRVIDYIWEYSHFTMAQNLGVKYRPTDLTPSQLEIFTHIRECIAEHNKEGGRGN